MRSKKALLNITSNLLLELIIVLYGFIVPYVIINKFGSSVNGLVSSITQFLAYIALLESGFGPVVKSALYKPIAKNDDNTIANILKTTEKFFRTIAYIFLLYIIVLCFLYPLLVSNDFEWLYTVSLIIIIGISTFAEYFFGMTYRLFLQAEQKTYIISAIRIITYILSIILIIFLAYLGASIQIIKLVSGIIFVFRPLLQNYYVRKKYKINLKSANGEYELKQKWDGLAQHIAAVIHGNTDITVLTIFTSLAEVSVYSVYFLVIKAVKSLIQSLTGGIDATFGDMIAKDEINNLNKRFSMYEVLYNSICTIAFTCTMILIVPFVSIYTKGVNDVNYIRYAFGTLLVISEYIWAIRLPYSSITLAAGHFKETRKGAWIECIINISLSIALVWKFGLIGVTIGTIIAMLVRTFEFIYHANKYVLKRKIWKSIKQVTVIIIETLVILLISSKLSLLDNINYINLLINALVIGMLSSTIVIVINSIVYKKELKGFKNLIKSLFLKSKKTR